MMTGLRLSVRLVCSSGKVGNMVWWFCPRPSVHLWGSGPDRVLLSTPFDTEAWVSGRNLWGRKTKGEKERRGSRDVTDEKVSHRGGSRHVSLLWKE